MQLNRETVLAKLTGYLDKEISKSAIYEWALFVAVSKEYEQVVSQDPLVANTVQALIDINHDDLKKIPTHKALEYYRRCLKGELEFIPLEDRMDIDQLGIPDEPPPSAPVSVGPETARVNALIKRHDYTRVLKLMRLYVVGFALSSLGIHIFSVIDPDFIRLTGEQTSRWNSARESLPHVLYAFLVLLPPAFLAKDILYPAAIALLTTGFFYYWYIAYIIVQKLTLHPLFILVFLPFSAVPATLAVLQLLAYRKSLAEE